VDDLDFIDLISVADYSEEWEKKKKPIQKKIRRYYLLHEVGMKGYSCPRQRCFAAAVHSLQLPTHLPEWLARFITSMLLPALGL